MPVVPAEVILVAGDENVCFTTGSGGEYRNILSWQHERFGEVVCWAIFNDLGSREPLIEARSLFRRTTIPAYFIDAIIGGNDTNVGDCPQALE